MLTIYALHYGRGLNFPPMVVLAVSLLLLVTATVLNHFALKAPQ
ncbi:hypothetical protein QMK19_39225 [Streptomyces sp. H10-C2]|nr:MULTISPECIES: hypothetical protein [unclassified Streptomyces]MDJ0347232.1 hypothetical protein [Streptomyces sp. PH10-H1]MDJ0375467.1 hypothetical protein [Streptomyces sp. H10-C2]